MPGFKFSQKNYSFFLCKIHSFVFVLSFFLLSLLKTNLISTQLDLFLKSKLCFPSRLQLLYVLFFFCFFCFFLSVSVVAAVAQWVEPIYSTLNHVSWPVPYNNNVFPSSVSVMRRLRDWSSYSVMSLIWPSKREDSGRISISWWCPVTVGGNKAWKPAFCFNWHGSSCWALMSLVALTKIINAY